jgi:Sulfotransferase family
MSAPWERVGPPTVVGGTGGSGTRVATKLLSCGSVYMGSHLNVSGDSLDLAQFDTSWGNRYLETQLAGGQAPREEMRLALSDSVAEHLSEWSEDGGPWGWKHPHSYLLLPFLDSVIPDLRFVHFVRDGRRMAFSTNQRQQQHYGPTVFGTDFERWEPHVRSIAFWNWANGWAADYGEEHMGARYLRVRFEDVCAEPQRTCRQLIDFARNDTQASDAEVLEAAALISSRANNKLDRKQAAKVRSVEVPGLTRFGYA